MPVIGSSLITPPQFVEGPRGNTGLAGITGLAGASGVPGASGPTGATGIFVLSGYPSPSTRDLILVLSDGREFTIKDIAGPTGASGTAYGLNTGTGGGKTYDIFKEVTDGVTFWFKGLSAEGTLDVYETSDIVGISGDVQYQRGATAPSVQGGRYAYLERMIGGATAFAGFTYAGATGSELTSSETGSIPFGKAAAGNLYSYDPEEIVIPIGPMDISGTYGLTGSDYSENPWGTPLADGVGIQLPVTRGSVYDVETPIGIRGFTGEFSSDEVFSFTMHLKGNDLWDWPENIYFDKNDLYFSCGYDIINFLTSDGGVSWKANVAVRGYGTSECQSVHGVGSCCYTDDENELNCRDYMTESECHELDSPFPDGEHGYWGPFSTCAENCGMTAQGVCCSEGGEWGNFGGTTRICLENVGATECDYFGGTFWTHYYYTKDDWGRAVPLDPPVVIECVGDRIKGGGGSRSREENCTTPPIGDEGCCCWAVGDDDCNTVDTVQGTTCKCDYQEASCISGGGKFYVGETCGDVSSNDGWGICCYGCETTDDDHLGNTWYDDVECSDCKKPYCAVDWNFDTCDDGEGGCDDVCKLLDGTCLYETCLYGEVGSPYPPPMDASIGPGDSAWIIPDECKDASTCEASVVNGYSGKYSPLVEDFGGWYKADICSCPLDEQVSGSGNGWCQQPLPCCRYFWDDVEPTECLGVMWQWECEQKIIEGDADHMPLGTDCNSCFGTDIHGACCVGPNCMSPVSSDYCYNEGGIYQGDETDCGSTLCGGGGGDMGSCCIPFEPGGDGGDGGDSDSSDSSDSDSGDSDSSDSDSSDSSDSDSDSGGGETHDECPDDGTEVEMFCCAWSLSDCDCENMPTNFCCKPIWCPFDAEDCWDSEAGEQGTLHGSMADCEEACCQDPFGHKSRKRDFGDGYECVLNMSLGDCTAAGGVWNEFGECAGECDNVGDECTNHGGELCINPCCDPIACCKDGSCIGDTYGNYDDMHPETQLPPLTRVSCEYVYGGIAVPGVCGEVDCCNATIYVGACCIENVEEACEVMTAQTCKDSNGVFMGPNSICDTVDCCEPGGACCIIGLDGLSDCQDVADEQACDDMGGEWQGRGTECATVTCTGRGACCYPAAGCEDDVPATNCVCAGCTYWGDGSTCCPPE